MIRFHGYKYTSVFKNMQVEILKHTKNIHTIYIVENRE